MARWAIPLFLILFASPPARPAEVVFIEWHEKGIPVQLEPGGRFLHVAIRVGDKWFHAHPHAGVVLVDDILPYGHRFLVLRNDLIPDPDPALVARWLGKPFDSSYTWDNPKATYCSRLVAELLGIPPQPMTFRSEIWKSHFQKTQGAPGMSPDKLFAALTDRGFRPPPCEGDLETP